MAETPQEERICFDSARTPHICSTKWVDSKVEVEGEDTGFARIQGLQWVLCRNFGLINLEELDKNYEKDMYLAFGQTLGILTNLVKVCGSACSDCSTDLLFILLQVQGFGTDSSLKQVVSGLEEVLAHAFGFSCARDLYESQADHLLTLVTAEHETWSTDSYGQALFQVLLQKIASLVGPYLKRLLPVVKGCLDPERDPSLRIKLLQLLDELFETLELAPCWSSLATIVLGQILVPCGIWRIGKVGAAVRHAAMVALGTFLRRNLCNQSDLEHLVHSNQVLPVLLSCLEEDYYVDIRIVTCHVLENLLQICGRTLNDMQREEIQKALQKRLDDSNDGVRLRVLPAISSFFCVMPTSYSDTSVRSFVANILVHLDDSNTELRERVYKVLEVCASLKPTIVEDLVKNKCDEYQTREYCDNLLAKAASSLNMGTMIALSQH
ncbi:hypothetical protein L7F22_038456 [Adiantum nelumboides]|nr:hypothetical protein [Adiantum nelumboides]